MEAVTRRGWLMVGAQYNGGGRRITGVNILDRNWDLLLWKLNGSDHLGATAYKYRIRTEAKCRPRVCSTVVKYQLVLYIHRSQQEWHATRTRVRRRRRMAFRLCFFARSTLHIQCSSPFQLSCSYPIHPAAASNSYFQPNVGWKCADAIPSSENSYHSRNGNTTKLIIWNIIKRRNLFHRFLFFFSFTFIATDDDNDDGDSR